LRYAACMELVKIIHIVSTYENEQDTVYDILYNGSLTEQVKRLCSFNDIEFAVMIIRRAVANSFFIDSSLQFLILWKVVIKYSLVLSLMNCCIVLPVTLFSKGE
jgi:hypothetical protein